MSSESAAKRSGRRPGPTTTREAIAGAARRQFAELGYDRATLRGIAGEAGVDAALVVRFYGSKEALFREVMALPPTVAEAIADLADFDLHRHSHVDLLTRAWKLRENITAYDAVYVALAEALEAPIVTCDAPLAKAPGHRARIEVIV